MKNLRKDGRAPGPDFNLVTRSRNDKSSASNFGELNFEVN
jgi:hypothetical protein